MATVNGLGSANSKTEVRSWANLPDDMLVLVFKRLLSVCDRIRFRAICKNWRLPAQLIQGLFPIPKVPWTMEYMWEKTEDSSRTLSFCKLCEPDLHQGSSPSRSYIIENGMIEGRSNFVDAEACASRDGWVLFSQEEGKGTFLLFFFSPFTKEVISLPHLESSGFKVATFSSAPTSPDCVVFVAHPLQALSMSLSIYRPCGDDKTWDSSTFRVPVYFGSSVQSVAYMGGSFYCHFGCLRMTSFNIANQEWRVLRKESARDFDDDVIIDGSDFDNDMIIDESAFCFSKPNYLLECDGELLVAYSAKDHEWFFLFSLDLKRMTWGRRKALRGGAIFLGKTSFWISSEGETEIVANRVHHYSGGTPIFYLSPGDYPSESLQEHRDGCKICYHPCAEGLKTIWIAPPREF